MLILWIRKAKKDKQQKRSMKDKESTFRKHDEIMKKFRLSHPELEVINDNDILTGDGNLLAPVNMIKLAENVQN